MVNLTHNDKYEPCFRDRSFDGKWINVINIYLTSFYVVRLMDLFCRDVLLTLPKNQIFPELSNIYTIKFTRIT